MMRGMYVILTSKPGQFRAEPTEGLRAVESYDYTFCGRKRAHFVIAQLDMPTRVRIVDETPPEVVNLVPTKFLEKFQTIEAARRQLEALAGSGGAQAALSQVPLP
jgi:hypothetical protein